MNELSWTGLGYFSMNLGFSLLDLGSLSSSELYKMLLWKYAVEKHETQPWKRELDKS